MPFLIPFLVIFAVLIGASVCEAAIKANNKRKKEKGNEIPNKKVEVEEYSPEHEQGQEKAFETDSVKQENSEEEVNNKIKKTRKKHKRKVFNIDTEDKVEDAKELGM